MKKCLFLFISAGIVFLEAFGQRPPDSYFHAVAYADSLLQAKEYAAAGSAYSHAFELFSGKGLVTDRYKAACAYAKAGNADSAFYNLFRIADKGNWSEHESLVTDPDLYSLQKDERWNKLVNKVRENKAEIEAHLNKPLAAELEKIFDNDQKYRVWLDDEKLSSAERDSLTRQMHVADSTNLVRVTQLLDEYGWLGADDVGRKGNQTLFLVIQHSTPEIRAKYLPVMRVAAERNKASQSELALLEDRVLMDQGKNQIYGSQVWLNPKTNRFEVYPISDEASVDERRAEVGLPPLQVYLKQFGIQYTPLTEKKR